MILASVIISFFNGRISEVTKAISSGADTWVKTVISLCGVLCFWGGITKICEDSGLSKILIRTFEPIINFCFPKLKSEPKAKNAIGMSMIANFLGLSNAGTPLAISAMEELDKYNTTPGIATNEMCTFLVLNVAPISLFSTTAISLRQSYGSINPGETLPMMWLTTLIALLAGIAACKICESRCKAKSESRVLNAMCNNRLLLKDGAK
jgi:spore maturation protein A